MIDKIKIGGIHYDVKYVERLQGDQREALNGNIEYNTATINLDSGLNAQVAMRVMLHEILHGIVVANGHNSVSEDFIDSTAYGLLQVLRDNPQLIDAVKELE